jgi:hypothetical protein
VYGAASSNNTVLSTSGLNLTLTGGSITSVSRRGDNTGTPICVSPGSTVTLNGFEYVVTENLDYLPTSTVPIEMPRAYLLATNGSPSLGAGLNVLPSNNDWAGQTIEIGDVTYTISSHTTTVITLTANYTGTTGLYTGTITTGLKVMAAQNARLNIYHGIDVRIQCKLRFMRVINFSGNGVDMNTERYPSAFIGTEPNANNCYFERVNCDFNSGSGWAFFGVNSNNFETHSINAENNHGWGYYESGSLGANHYSWHNAYNYQGAFRMSGVVASNQIISCYTEGGQASAIIGQYTFVHGGVMGAGIDNNFGYSTFVTSDQGLISTESGLRVAKLARKYNTISVPKSIMIRMGSKNEPATLLAWGAGEDAANTGLGYPASNPQQASYFLSYDYNLAGWYSLGYGVNWSVTNNMIAVSGSAASGGAGLLAFPTGFRTQTGDAQITRILSATATLDFDLTSVTSQDLTVTVTGAAVGDVVSLGVPHGSVTADTLFFGWVSASNTVTVRAMRIAGTPNPASGTFRVQVTKF